MNILIVTDKEHEPEAVAAAVRTRFAGAMVYGVIDAGAWAAYRNRPACLGRFDVAIVSSSLQWGDEEEIVYAIKTIGNRRPRVIVLWDAAPLVPNRMTRAAGPDACAPRTSTYRELIDSIG